MNQKIIFNIKKSNSDSFLRYILILTISLIKVSILLQYGKRLRKI